MIRNEFQWLLIFGGLILDLEKSLPHFYEWKKNCVEFGAHEFITGMTVQNSFRLAFLGRRDWFLRYLSFMRNLVPVTQTRLNLNWTILVCRLIQDQNKCEAWVKTLEQTAKDMQHRHNLDWDFLTKQGRLPPHMENCSSDADCEDSDENPHLKIIWGTDDVIWIPESYPFSRNGCAFCLFGYSLVIFNAPLETNLSYSWTHSEALKMLMGCIQISQIRSNDISIDIARWADPNSRMADSNVAPLPRNWFLKFVPSSTYRNSMGRREGKIVPDSPPHVSSCNGATSESAILELGSARRALSIEISFDLIWKIWIHTIAKSINAGL